MAMTGRPADRGKSRPAHGGAMVMGDLVLLQTEINPVMTKLIENGLEITAVHNHLLRADPLTFYMHVGGHGDAVKLATALRSGLAESKTPLAARYRVARDRTNAARERTSTHEAQRPSY
jgi:hypothetical protein